MYIWYNFTAFAIHAFSYRSPFEHIYLAFNDGFSIIVQLASALKAAFTREQTSLQTKLQTN